MPEAIRNCVSSMNCLDNFWDEQDFAKGYPVSEHRINRYQVAYGIRSEISEVDDYVPTARAHELGKFLECASLELEQQQSDTESVNVSDLEWLPIEVMDMSASRMQFHQAFLTGVSGVLWIHCEKFPVSWWAATGYGLATRSEKIADIEVQGESTTLLKDVSVHLREQMEEWGIQGQVYAALDNMRDTYRSLQGAELSLSTDPEIPERQRIRVTLTVSGTPEEVFEDELCFREWMCSELDAKAGELITITYRWK